MKPIKIYYKIGTKQIFFIIGAMCLRDGPIFFREWGVGQFPKNRILADNNNNNNNGPSLTCY